jgi:hypothetical protein
MTMENKKDIEQVINDDFETNPEKWHPITDLSMFEANETSLDNTDWDAFDYSCARDENWYRSKFPGFDEEICKILAHCDGTNRRPENEKNIWEKRNALEEELKQKLTVDFD